MIYTLTKDDRTYRTTDRGEVVNMTARGWAVEAEEKAEKKARPAARNKARKTAQNKARTTTASKAKEAAK